MSGRSLQISCTTASVTGRPVSVWCTHKSCDSEDNGKMGNDGSKETLLVAFTGAVTRRGVKAGDANGA